MWEVGPQGCMEDGLTMCDSPPICNIPNSSNNNGDISNSNNINKVRSGANMFVQRYYIHYTLEKHFARTNILFPRVLLNELMFLFWVQDSWLKSRATKPHWEKSENIHFKYLWSQYLPIRLGRQGNIEYFCNVFNSVIWKIWLKL